MLEDMRKIVHKKIVENELQKDAAQMKSIADTSNKYILLDPDSSREKKVRLCLTSPNRKKC